MSSPELAGEVCPRRFGLNYDPPAIILEYLEVKTGKLFHRKVTLKRLRASADPARVAEKLRQKNRPLLTEDSGVCFDQIVSLVKKLQDAMSHDGVKASDDAATPTNQEVDYHQVNLNKLDDDELAQHKARMDISFRAHQTKPSDEGFVYDVRVEFPEGEQANDWDSDDD
mmetsp:Transcript_71164/g.169899  ORF Transcript_71164/g.169899 Transcript_71164/m.169899 type:complete len:169 (+) Transcript_71164:34-540(+)|eukprot:CAMPEP_0181451658 /NCGR_PEP_ID=MMETSP1110-20121109/28805_1 /TAXON_ID=174948 /ORGANISM="Symbiodinium sp., Strain CCMP421" /LENGTH=168 /DNA_ID=CAMNT_0023575917 /DNA_START=28 /DNA_END=534 /DNA_ORIENTATION=+